MSRVLLAPMAPGRRRGAKGGKTKSELNLGDLILAKVKGHPAWPAKVEFQRTMNSVFSEDAIFSRAKPLDVHPLHQLN